MNFIFSPCLFKSRSADLPGVLLLVGAASVFSGCGSSQVKESAEEAARQALKTEVKSAKSSLEELGNVVSSGATLSGRDAKGRALWSVGAKQINAHEEKLDANDKVISPRRAELTDARATLYRDGKAHSTFRAPKIALVYAESGVLLNMTGGVQMKTPGTWNQGSANKSAPGDNSRIAALARRGPIEVQTPQVNVDVKARQVRANNGVVMTQGKTRVTAKQLFADSELATARLGGNVQATSPEGALRATKATWNWKEGRALAQGKVVLSHEKTILTGARLVADTNGSRGELSGDVRADAPEGKARAGRVLYDWGKGALSVRDAVTLQKEDGTLRAARIDADDKFRTVTASGGVTLRKKDVTLTAAQITAFDKMSRAVATGDVVLIRPDATLRAARAEVWVDANRAVGNSVRIVRGDVRVQAARAEILNAKNKESARIIASGGVVAQNPQGTVRASTINWGGGRVVASRGVTLQKDGNSLSGARLQSDDKFKTATLTGSVRGRLARGGSVTAGVLLLRDGRIFARNGVTGRRDNLRMRADTLDATRDGQHATLRGNVLLTSDDGITAQAPLVRYDKAAGKVYASGGVTVNDPKHGKQRGRLLVADLGLKKATLTDVTGSFNDSLFKDRKLF